MTNEDALKHVAALAKRAAETDDANDAMKLSQSAVNIANALCSLGAAMKME